MKRCSLHMSEDVDYEITSLSQCSTSSALFFTLTASHVDVNVQGCQMAYFQTKNPNLVKFLRVLKWKMLVYFMAIWSIFRSFGIFCGHLVYFTVNWYIFPVLIFCKKNLAILSTNFCKLW
jgi:hypothetical protein